MPPVTSLPLPLIEIGFENGVFAASTTPCWRKNWSQVIQPICSIQITPVKPVKNEPVRPMRIEPSSLMSKISTRGRPTEALICAGVMVSHRSPSKKLT